MNRTGLHLAVFTLVCLVLAIAAGATGRLDLAIVLASTSLCMTALFIWDELSNYNNNRKTKR